MRFGVCFSAETDRIISDITRYGKSAGLYDTYTGGLSLEPLLLLVNRQRMQYRTCQKTEIGSETALM